MDNVDYVAPMLQETAYVGAGVYLISDGSEYPWRAKLRGPSFVNLQMLPALLRGYKMSDVVAIIGSIDFLMGDADR
jgi:NADH-quinone oxidoreductase subunit D